MTTSPTTSTGACSAIISTKDDLAAWMELLVDDRHGTAVVLDQHGHPRLMEEHEHRQMYVTSVDDEDGDAPWDPAEKELFFYGPFTVIHPPLPLPPSIASSVEDDYLSALAGGAKAAELHKFGTITTDDNKVLRAGFDAARSLLVDNVRLRSALAARDAELAALNHLPHQETL